jgi:diaminohydroxyphosphoribosylaminopyrimidine deaminase/5-amino-6-(5-phosphoribosylamino)uracil reductase
LVIDKKIKRVVVSCPDPNPLVNGQGIKKLKEKGVEVEVGILEQEGSRLNHRFFTFIKKNRPYIILKWAQTADGFLARKNYDSKWISHEQSRQFVHKWRAEEDAVLVGTRTAQHDNPILNVRNWTGRDPTRIVLDRFLRLSDKLNLFDKSQPTFCYNVLRHEEHDQILLIRVDEKDFIQQVIHDLLQRKIQSLIVEGGAQTLQLFLERGLWDEARIFNTQKTFGEGVVAPTIQGIRDQGITMMDKDELVIYRNPKS